jgi:hypothetical protein
VHKLKAQFCLGVASTITCRFERTRIVELSEVNGKSAASFGALIVLGSLQIRVTVKRVQAGVLRHTGSILISKAKSFFQELEVRSRGRGVW